MRKSCEREPDSFLLVMGELRGWAKLGAAAHWAICSACRQEAGRLKATAGQIRGALAPSASGVVASRWLLKSAGLAAVAVTIAGLWILGREAVNAAMAAGNKPRYQQTFHPDSEPNTMRAKSKPSGTPGVSE